jgi:two-component system NtrC family sensor kinase
MTPAAGAAAYGLMFRTMVRRLLLVSLLPLLAIGGANFYLFYRLNRSIVIEQHANALRSHRVSIEIFLSNVTAMVSALAQEYTLAELMAGNLERAFPVIQHQSGVFTDIGIIDSTGNHVKYIGPYDLAGKNYRDTDWFWHVVEKGVYISDVFPGYRGVPHFIIAVKRGEGGGFWILRATLNTDYFSRLVATRIGQTGETFIVNSEGLYQTTTRSGGALLAPSGFPDLMPHDDIRVRELDIGGARYLYTTTWLSNPRWLLISRQAGSDVYSPLRRASIMGISIFLVGAIGAVALAVAVARQQVQRIKKTDKEKEALTQRLLVTGKTAAVGEMSAGLAHEINNPLATIHTLQTWIRDLATTSPISEDDRKEILDSTAKIAEQVERCKTITQGLLKFSRRVETKAEALDLNRLLEELATFSQTRACIENATVQTALGLLPPIVAPPGHLQQIFVNLLNNALDAVAGKPNGMVLIRSRYTDGIIKVEISDNGCGILPENLSSIFLPFFTTKPVGQGTGLGLAICYGLVQDIGGTMRVESRVGMGTTFIVELPLRSARRAEGNDGVRSP